MTRKYRFDWDEDLGGLTPEQAVDECRKHGESFEDYAAGVAEEPMITDRRIEMDLPEEEWQDYLTQFRAWMVARLRATAREMAETLGRRIERDDPRCRVTGIRRHESGFCEVDVVDARTGIQFVVRDLEDWQVRVVQGAPVPPMLTVDDVAARLKLGRETIVRRIKAGQLRAHKTGGVYRIPPDALEDYLRATEVKIAPCPACREGLVVDVLCLACLESGRYLTCPCGAWAAYDDLRARHGDGLGGWAVVEEDEARYCPRCRPEDVAPGVTRLPQHQEEPEEDEEA